MSRLVRWVLAIAALWLLVLTMLRGATWWAFRTGGGSGADTLAIFWLGFRFDARVVAAVVLPVLVVGGWRRLHPFASGAGRKLWLALLGGAGGMLVVISIADFLHYRYLHQRLNASALDFLVDAKISATMVWQTYPVVRIVLAGALATGGLLAAAAWLHRRIAATPEPAARGWRRAWFGVVLVAGVIAIYGRVSQFPLRWSDAFDLRNDASANLALNPVQSLLSSLAFRGEGYDLAKVQAHAPFMSDYLGVPRVEGGPPSYLRRVAAPAGGPAVRMNVVLVLCESFSAYKSSMWGNPLDPTPFFAELCREGVFFDNCFTPHVGTARGVWATVTGVPDVALAKTASRNPAMVDQHTIIDDFAGYGRYYFLGGSSSWANIRGLLANNIRGLRIFEEGAFKSPRVDVWGISDKNLLLEADGVLREQREPFFAVIQTAGNHRPYTIPAEDRPEFALVDLPAAELQRHGYESNAELNAFRYTDFSFRKFMEAARRSPYFERTLFVFVGDHGIAGDAGQMFPSAWTEHALTSYHVPLLFYAPKLLRPERIHAVASMVDILPTVAGVAGIAYRNGGFGRDLLHQQRIDGGRSNVAFVMDHNNRTIGALRGPFLADRKLGETRVATVWADFSAAPPPGRTVEDPELAGIATAFYETARFQLLHNKKPAEPVGGK